MKIKNTIIVFAFAFLLIALPAVLAENGSEDSSAAISLYNDTSNLPAGMVISPAPENLISEEELALNESEDVSNWRLGWKQAGIWFTFNEEKKIQKELDLARLRLIQARIAAKNNNTIAMERALEAHERTMNRIKLKIEDMDKKNNTSKLTGLDRAIEVHEARIAKLNEILADSNITDAKRAKIEARISKVENVTARLKEIDSQKEDKKK